MITKGERTELRSVVRQQFKVLRSEIEQRKAELLAGVERSVTEKYRSEDETRETLTFTAGEIAREANRKMNDALVEVGLKLRDGTDRVFFGAPRLAFSDEARHRMRVEMNAEIEATVKGALARLERQEADLLRTLATGAVESDEAREFLAGIPTVGELVPAGRLLEIEMGPTEL